MKAFLFGQFILVLILSVCVIGVCSGEEVIPEMPKGTSLGGWHPSLMCDQCHATLIPKEDMPGLLGACKCHRSEFESSGKIDVVKINEVHGIKTCTRCHIGSWGRENILTYDTIHRVHAPIDCSLCHGEKDNIVVPENKECNICHKEDVHFVHGNKTEDLCFSCHGIAAQKYLDAEIQLEEIFIVNNNTTTTHILDGRSSYPTILNILKSLVDLIFG